MNLLADAEVNVRILGKRIRKKGRSRLIPKYSQRSEQTDRIDHPANKCCFIEVEVSIERNKPYLPSLKDRLFIAFKEVEAEP